MDSSDYERFLLGLFEFNDVKATTNLWRQKNTTSVWNPTSNREMLVDIVCFCLMPNHYHLILRQRTDHGISKFMQKLGVGYTNYFNLKYRRSGVLFQGKFKAIHVTTDEYLTHLSRYIHLNPVELVEPAWKKKHTAHWGKVEHFLASYPWSSYPAYLNPAHPFTSLIDNHFIRGYFGKPFGTSYKTFMKEWASDHMHKVNNLIIEE